jgi:hypothetical protein
MARNEDTVAKASVTREHRAREARERARTRLPPLRRIPIDRATGGLLDGGKPWAPIRLPTLAALLERAEASP